MRILALSWWFPYPPDNGARLRVFNLLRQFGSKHQVTLVAFSREARDTGYLDFLKLYCQEVYLLPGRTFHRRSLKAWMGFLSSKPRAVVDTYNPEAASRIQQIASNGQYDLVVAFEVGPALGVSPYVAAVKETPALLEDLELAVLKEQFARQCDLWGRLRYGMMWWKSRRYTVQMLRRFDVCTVASARERANVLEIMPNYQGLEIIPNGIDAKLCAGDYGLPEADTLIFTGALTYDANFDAMRFFLGEVFPLLKTRRPGLRLRITGSTEGVPVDDLPLMDGVAFTGYVDDVRPLVARSQVCVAPMRIGGGTRLKILEAMALGTPVVATSKGAEGLEVVPGQHLLIADEPERLAETIVTVLQDHELQATLSRNGRELVRAKYDWNVIGQQYEAILNRLANGRR
jgi:glycosyltransferase involved in cell wall biosynthesis